MTWEISVVAEPERRRTLDLEKADYRAPRVLIDLGSGKVLACLISLCVDRL